MDEIAESVESTEPINNEGSEEGAPVQAQPIGQTQTRSAYVTVDGQNYEVSEDKLKQFYGVEGEPLTDREWKTMVSAYKAHIHGDLRSKKVDKQDKLMGEIAELIQHNPKELLKRAGYDIRQFSEQILAEMIEEEMLPEAERELKKERREKELLQKQIEEHTKARDEEQLNYLTKQAENDYTQSIISALEGSKLPKSPDVVRRIAYYMLKGEQKGINVNPKQIVPLVEEDIRNLQTSMLDSLDPAALMEFLGEERMKKIRKADIERVKTPPNFVGTRSNSKSVPAPKTDNRQTKEEWRAMIKERVKG